MIFLRQSRDIVVQQFQYGEYNFLVISPLSKKIREKKMTRTENRLFLPPFGGLGVCLEACRKASKAMTLLRLNLQDHSSFTPLFSLSDAHAGMSGYDMQLALGRETRGR